MSAPEIILTGGGGVCSRWAAAWGARSASHNMTSEGLEAAIWSWRGERRAEFRADVPLAKHLIARPLQTYRGRLTFEGELFRDGLFSRNDVLLHAVGRLPLSLNEAGSVAHVLIPDSALRDALVTVSGSAAAPLDQVRLTDPAIPALFDLVERELARPDASSLMLDALELAFAIAVARDLTGVRLAVDRGGLAPFALRRAIDRMRDTLSDQHRLVELASECGLSQFHFARAFKASTGLPPHAWQRQLRIQRAKDLLETTDLAVTEVALAVGYESSQALARLFAREVGCTPTHWRRERRG